MEYQTDPSSGLQSVDTQTAVTQAETQKPPVEARTSANKDTSEGKVTQKQKVQKMLKAGFSPQEVSKSLGANIGYVYKIKSEIKTGPKPIPLVIIPEETLQAARTRQRKETMLLQLHHCHGIVDEARKRTGIEYKTHLTWMKNDPWYAERFLEIQEATVDYVEGHLFKQIEKGVPQSTIFYLKTRGKHRGYNEKIDVDANVNGSIEIRVIEPRPLEQDLENEDNTVDGEYEVIEPEADSRT